MSLGSVDEGHAARNFPDRRRPVIGSERPPFLLYVHGSPNHIMTEDAAARFDCRRASSALPRRLDQSGHDAGARERALWPALKTNRFPVTSDDAGLQIEGRGIRPRPSAILGPESRSTP